MAEQLGLFVVLEGADGCGKSGITDHLVPALQAAGHAVRRIERGRPTGDPAHADLVRAVNRLFRSPQATATGWEHLTLAAAAQYHSILHAQVAPAVAAGQIVIAESWWDKTWVRLGLEAELSQGLDVRRRQQLEAWQRSLLPPGPLPAHQRLTVLVDTPQQDRVTWYKAAHCPDPVLSRTGVWSHDPDEYGDFTEHIAVRLRHVAAQQGWPAVTNSCRRTPAQVAADLCDLVERRTRSTVPAPEPT